ncbi:peptide/nickel transport system substrate-binding protein [Palleronia aestuarii]|uniref:Peptide/nickel transport system substrate-binding protein n=1 Tax=Palleronia aestuarii TaxID=568105 RepID=A0A2W7NDV1_9RHOB|nr:ABC transporter substrate-binding protein [Palleronia aestuarii]PZX14924.1 peptide/nickel transport system substrate-binding protein [Palleronia aestuarii]
MRYTAIAFASALALGVPAAVEAQSRYVHANNSAYDTLDPHTVFDVARVATRLNFYDGLYRWVDNPPELIPWLATEHTVSEDGLTWTFTLRDDVAFHDGTMMTAEDVVYSMERMLALASGAGALFQPMLEPGATQAVDEHTVSFTLKEPSAIFASLVPDILVVNSALLKENEVDDDWGQAYLTDNVAGSGSYILQRYDPAIGFIGERNADHFAGWGERYYDEIEFRTVLETNTRIQGLMRGDYQGLDGYLAPDQVKRLRSDEDVQILEEESMRVYHIAMHNGRPPLDDLNFRMAMNHAFDYEGYINAIMQGTVVRNPTIVPGNLWGVPDVAGYEFDLEKAQEYLDAYKAEHGDDIRTLNIGTLAGFAETEQAAALMQNGLAQLGIDVEIASAPWPVISSNMRNPETMPDMVPYWKSTYYADPNNWIGEQYGSRYAPTRNVSDYHNAEVDKRLEEALLTTDQEERDRLYKEAGQIVYDDAAGIWIYNTKWYGPYADSVEGIRFSPVGNGQDMRWAYPAEE